MSKLLLLKPRQSEKTYALSQTQNVFVFDVPLNTNKIEVKKAVETQFSVSVTDVKMLINKGKMARSIRIGAKTRASVSGRRKDIKKAYVTLAEGNSIPVFAAIDEQIEKEAKMNKVAEKALAKEEKKAKTAEVPKKRGILGRANKKGDK